MSERHKGGGMDRQWRNREEGIGNECDIADFQTATG